MTDTAISTLAPRRAAIIGSDGEAIAVARELAADFAREAAQRDR
jgi:hypothetical protein